MTNSEIEMAKLKNADKIARRHEDREDARNKRSVYGKIGGDAGKLVAGAIGKMINSPDWYKQYLGLEGVNTTIPDYTVGDTSDASLRNGLGSVPNEGNTSVFCVRYYQTIGQGKIAESTTVSNLSNYGAVGEINTSISRIRAQLGKRNSLAFSTSKDTFGRYMVGVVDSLFVPMKRMKAAIDWYTVANAFYPKLAEKMISALGFVPSDFEANIATNRDNYNKWANKINASIPMVKSNTFLERRMFLCGLTLKDRDDVRAQHVVFVPQNEAYFSDADDLVRYRFVSRESSKEFWANLDDSYLNIIDGATWKTVIRLFLSGFDASEFYQLPVKPDEVTSFVGYSEEMLNQLHNMVTCPHCDGLSAGYDGSSFYVGHYIGDSFTLGGDTKENLVQGVVVEHPSLITTGVGAIIPRYGPVKMRYSGTIAYPSILADNFPILPSNTAYGQKIVFNTFKKASADDFLVGTRLTTMWRCLKSTGTLAISTSLGLRGFDGTSTSTNYYVSIFPGLYGTEVVDSIAPITTDSIPASARAYPYSTITNEDEGYWNDSYLTDLCADYTYHSFIYFNLVAHILERYGQASAIDWLPLTKVCTGSTQFTTFGELSHYTIMPFDALFKLHGQAILSEFSIGPEKFLAPLK